MRLFIKPGVTLDQFGEITGRRLYKENEYSKQISAVRKAIFNYEVIIIVPILSSLSLNAGIA